MLQLRKFRVHSQMTQAEVAERLGVTQPTYQRWETGRVDIPADKLREAAILFEIPVDFLTGSHPPIGIAIYNERAPLELQYYGEVAFHFVGGGAPLLLHISERELQSLFAALQEDSFYVIADSLSNQHVAIRRAAISDVSISSEACDDYGPEHGVYEVPPIMMPDPRDWRIVEALEDGFDLKQFQKKDIERVRQAIENPWQDPVDNIIAGGRIERNLDQEAIREAFASTFSLASDVRYQLSNGKLRRFPCRGDASLFRSLYGAFEMDSEDTILFDEQEDGRAVFINPQAIDYISVPMHKWEDASVEGNDGDE